jgi:hypothetical protein
VLGVSELDLDAMLQRFRDRAAAVKRRNMPPVEGEQRKEFVRQAQLDFQDFALLGDAEATIEDGVVVFRIDLRPPDQRT